MHLGSSCLSDRGKRGDEPHSNSVVIKRPVLYPTLLERDECFDLPVRAAPQATDVSPWLGVYPLRQNAPHVSAGMFQWQPRLLRRAQSGSTSSPSRARSKDRWGIARGVAVHYTPSPECPGQKGGDEWRGEPSEALAKEG